MSGGTGFEWLPEPPDELRRLAAKVSNWGRWGTEDELGTLNHLTPARRARAAALAVRGEMFSLSIPFDEAGPQTGLIGRINPVRTMTATGLDGVQKMDLGGGARYTDDFVAMPLQCATHWDSLAHVFYDGQLYNGVPSSAVDSMGAAHNGIDKTHDALAGRGVLLDLARSKGVPCLESTTAITVTDLEAAEYAQGVEVGAGDILLVRTGLMGTWRERGDWSAFHGMQPGLHYETVVWLHEREVAAVAADNAAVEHLGLSLPGVMLPLHMLALRDMGLSLGEYFFLEDLADDCERDGRWEFLLVAPPLRFTRAVGGPANPVAVK